MNGFYVVNETLIKIWEWKWCLPFGLDKICFHTADLVFGNFAVEPV